MEIISQASGIKTVLNTSSRHQYPIHGHMTPPIAHHNSKSPQTSTNSSPGLLNHTQNSPLTQGSNQSSPGLQSVTLNLSSQPNTPGSALSVEDTKINKRPSSPELILPSYGSTEFDTGSKLGISKSQWDSKDSGIPNHNERHPVQFEECSSSKNSSASVKQPGLTVSNQLTDWTQALQNLAVAFHQNGAKSDETASPTKDVDPMARFHSMLTSMGQILLNTQSAITQENKRESSPCSPRTDSLKFLPSTQQHDTQLPNNPSVSLPIFPLLAATATAAAATTTTTPVSSLSSLSPSTFDPCGSSLAASTASLLFMMMTHRQKDLFNSTFNSDPLASGPTNNLHPPPQAVLSQHPHTTPQLTPVQMDSTADSYVSNFNLSKSRDILYQLGQRLMAMATSPSTADCTSKQSAASNCTKLADTKSSTNSEIPFSFSFHPDNQATSLPNPIMAIMNAVLFPTSVPSSYCPPFSNGLMSLSSDQKLGLHSNAVLQLPLEKGLHNLTPSGSGLSGISMRGNQKYSAYYQHQRKQGFQMGASNDCGNAGSSRRHGSSSSTSPASTRYGNRRLRSSLGNSAHTTSGTDVTRGVSRSSRGSLSAFGGPMLPCFRGASYKHPLVNGISSLSPNRLKSQQPPDSSTTGASLSSHSETTNRHRDTAFLCSCGKDFESLYVFTLHMKDTGHKPKSDQSERDIPKLVRGQDMWINSETEQTREILRCMRCHQSFRSLPELTMHMMKTNHYSEIVYNDSGRLVFVNPDEHRRGTSVAPNSGSNNTSPSKSASQTAIKRCSKGMPCTSGNPTVSSPWSNGFQSPSSTDDIVAEEKHNLLESTSDILSPYAQKLLGVSKRQIVQAANSRRKFSDGSTAYTKLEPDQMEEAVMNADDDEENTPTQTASSGPPDLSVVSASPLSSKSSRPDESEISVCADSSTDPNDLRPNSSVIRQMESFVEKSLPRISSELSAKTDHSNYVTSQASSPGSVLEEASHSSSTVFGPSENSRSSKSGRKRTHSGTPFSPRNLPLPSPKIEKDDVAADPTSEKRLLSSSPTATVSSSSEFNLPLTESPLSSLQKLVDTTHKPLLASSLHGSSSSSALFVSCNNLVMPSVKHFPSTRMVSKPLVHAQRDECSPGGKSASNTAGSGISAGSSGSNFSQLISPSDETDTSVPALSALYAYVEKSSPHHTSESASDGNGCYTKNTRQKDSGTLDEAEGNTHRDSRFQPNSALVDQNLASPAFQAFYMAALSSLAGQYLQSNVTENDISKISGDPCQIFSRIAPNIREPLDAIPSSGFQPNVDFIEKWAGMLQLISKQLPQTTEINDECISNRHVQNLSRQQAHHDQRHRAEADRCEANSSSNQVQDNTKPLSISLHNMADSRINNFTGSPMFSLPRSSPACSSSGYQSPAPAIPSSQYHLSVPVRSSGNSSSQSSIMSTMIAKKAKCHFCGKPFANKGQVRLHISKNKCPCLLQQSCHVAALAAAFGAESRNPTTPITTAHSNGKGSFTCFPHSRKADQRSSHDDSVEEHSALSLLKERFQNFEMNHSGLTKFEDLERFNAGLDTGHTGDSTPLTTTPDLSLMSDIFTPGALRWQDSKVYSASDQSPNSDKDSYRSTKTSSVAAAANASHLAAMALLAQTLAQLSSTQASVSSDTCGRTDTASQYNTNTMPGLSFPTPVPVEFPGTIPFNYPVGFTWESLLNQVNSIKHMGSSNWNANHTDNSGKDSPNPSSSQANLRMTTTSDGAH